MGRPASLSATCGASRSDCTRASTATCGGATPGSASQAWTASTRAAAPASAAWVRTSRAAGISDDVGTGPDLLGHPPVVVAEERRRGAS